MGGAKLGPKTLFKRGISAGSKAFMTDEGIKTAANIYKFGTSKIRNNNLKKALESDVANYIVQETQKKVKEDINNLFG